MAEVADRIREALLKYSPAISKAVAGLIAVMSPFMVWKYFNTNPFKDHGVVLSILIVAILIHLIFGLLIKNFIRSLLLSFCICLASGVIAIVLILFILFTQIWKLLVINVSVALLIALVYFFNQLASFFSFLLGKCFGSRDQPQEPEGDIDIMEIDPPDH